jgi:hypothetical protein
LRLDISDRLKGYERKYLLQLLPIQYAHKKFNGSRTKMAKFLGISTRCLQNKYHTIEELKQYRLEIEDSSYIIHLIDHYRNKGKDILESNFYRKASLKIKRKVKKILIKKGYALANASPDIEMTTYLE